MSRGVAPALPAALLVVAAFLAGGYYESTTALLGAAVWLGLSVAASLGAARRPSAAFSALAALAGWSLLSTAWGPLGPAFAATPLLVLYAGVLLVCALLAIGALVAVAAPGAVAHAASPNGGAAHAVYCPDKQARQRRLTAFIRTMQTARKTYFATHRSAKQRSAFVKAQQAQLAVLQRALAKCD